ncbi:hypothetical protein NEHOM01_0045 [Nematocida homosporus]|uniref:uncharacterized protein n=1 Tax=Nematocida homosporus TaxID=1912981 RepID=UPI00221F8613|nr:uncharacterized protein NEHOM01_0045 [Nematocida homosporus]KAI5184300.1 hypothetical protein NEHOM01_0045 [Nematocida homosporus]
MTNRSRDYVGCFCRKHLRHWIENTQLIEDKLWAGHLYYSRSNQEIKCPLKETNKCNDQIETLPTNALDLAVLVKGQLTSGLDAHTTLASLTQSILSMERLGDLRVGFETLLMAIQQISTSQTTNPAHYNDVLLPYLENIKDQLIILLDKKIAGTHYVIRTLIKSVTKELATHFGPSFLASVHWSDQAKLEMALFFEGSFAVVKQEDIDLINSKGKGDVVLKILRRLDPRDYADLLANIVPNCVGSRNLRVLAARLPPTHQQAIMHVLFGLKSFIVLYFISNQTDLPSYLLSGAVIHRNEEIRTEYFDLLTRRLECSEDTVRLVSGWLQLNQVLQAKENQTRAASAFAFFITKLRNKFLKRYKYIQAKGWSEPTLTAPIAYFTMIVKIVLGMCESQNIIRQLQGLHYLQALCSNPESASFVPTADKERIALSTIGSPYKIIRQAAAQLPLALPFTTVQSAYTAADTALFYGATLLFTTQSLSDAQTQQAITFATDQLASPSISILQTHKMVHLLWSIFNSASGRPIIIEAERINPEVMVETHKRQALKHTPLSLYPQVNLNSNQTIEHLYQHLITPLFESSLAIIQSRDIYLSSYLNEQPLSQVTTKTANNTNTTTKNTDSPPVFADNSEYVHHWYVLRETLLFIQLYAIITKDTTCLDRFCFALLTAGGHLGNIMVSSLCIKNLLLFFNSPTQTTSLAQTYLTEIEHKTFKTVRRDGGIPYLFKAICASETNLKQKPATHLILTTCIQKAFSLITNALTLPPIKNNTACLPDPDAFLLTQLSITSVPPSTPLEACIRQPDLLIHYLCLLKGVAGDSIFRYGIKQYEPALFLLSTILISHSNWKIRNAALMLYTTLIKKMCKETLNGFLSSSISPKYTKIAVLKESRQVLLSCLTFFTDTNDYNGIFSTLVFFCRLPDLTATESSFLTSLLPNTSSKSYPARIIQKLQLIITAHHSQPQSPQPQADSNQLIRNAHLQIPPTISEALDKLPPTILTDLLPSTTPPNPIPSNTTPPNPIPNSFTTCQGPHICMQATATLLSLLSHEDPRIKTYILNRLNFPYTHEYAQYLLITQAKCKSCLLKAIQASTTPSPIHTSESSLFPPDAEHFFRDSVYESILIHTPPTPSILPTQ